MELHIPAISAEREMFLRGIDNELTPERMYDITLALTGDELIAQKNKAWQWLNQSKTQ